MRVPALAVCSPSPSKEYVVSATCELAVRGVEEDEIAFESCRRAG